MSKHKFYPIKDTYGNDEFETTRMGFVFGDMWITEPFTSECGRFVVCPEEYYGITYDEANMIMKYNMIMKRTIDYEN